MHNIFYKMFSVFIIAVHAYSANSVLCVYRSIILEINCFSISMVEYNIPHALIMPTTPTSSLQREIRI